MIVLPVLAHPIAVAKTASFAIWKLACATLFAEDDCAFKLQREWEEGHLD